MVKKKKARKKRKGAGKGSAFERLIAKQLSLWYSGGKTDDVFWRSTLSGGRATARAKKGKKTKGQYGDLTSQHPKGQEFINFVCVEIKCGYNSTSCTLHDLLDDDKYETQFEKFLRQAIESSEQGNIPYWMLITKRDRKVALVHVPDVLNRKLGFMDSLCDSDTSMRTVFAIDEEVHDIISLPLDSFLDVVDPKQLRRLIRRYNVKTS